MTVPASGPPTVADAGLATAAVGTGTFGSFAYDPQGTPWAYSRAAGVAGNGSGFTSGNPNAPEEPKSVSSRDRRD